MTFRISGLTCACGAEDLISVKPGTDALHAPVINAAISPARSDAAWCAACWPFRSQQQENVTMAKKKNGAATEEAPGADPINGIAASMAKALNGAAHEPTGDAATHQEAAPAEGPEAINGVHYADADADEPEYDDAANREIAIETLTGDLRDFILDRLKHEQNKQPWHMRSEAEQRDTVHAVEAATRSVVTRAIEMIATRGLRTMKATLEQVVVKDGIKAVLIMSKHDAGRYQLMDAAGAKVLISVADPDEFTGERAPVAINPDQGTLLGEAAMAVHSTADDNRAPFN